MPRSVWLGIIQLIKERTEQYETSEQYREGCGYVKGHGNG